MARAASVSAPSHMTREGFELVFKAEVDIALYDLVGSLDGLMISGTNGLQVEDDEAGLALTNRYSTFEAAVSRASGGHEALRRKGTHVDYGIVVNHVGEVFKSATRHDADRHAASGLTSAEFRGGDVIAYDRVRSLIRASGQLAHLMEQSLRDYWDDPRYKAGRSRETPSLNDWDRVHQRLEARLGTNGRTTGAPETPTQHAPPRGDACAPDSAETQTAILDLAAWSESERQVMIALTEFRDKNEAKTGGELAKHLGWPEERIRKIIGGLRKKRRIRILNGRNGSGYLLQRTREMK
jgi:hypothetical protein